MSVLFGGADHSSRNFRTVGDAQPSGVQPFLLLAPMSAPFSNSNIAAALFPASVAKCKAVNPAEFCIETSAPPSRRVCTMLSCPFAAAHMSGVWSVLLISSTSHPIERRIFSSAMSPFSTAFRRLPGANLVMSLSTKSSYNSSNIILASSSFF